MDAAWNLGAWIAAIALAAATVAAVVALFIAGLWPLGVVLAVALGFAVLGRWDPLEDGDVEPGERSAIAERLGVSDR